MHRGASSLTYPLSTSRTLLSKITPSLQAFPSRHYSTPLCHLPGRHRLPQDSKTLRLVRPSPSSYRSPMPSCSPSAARRWLSGAHHLLIHWISSGWKQDQVQSLTHSNVSSPVTWAEGGGQCLVSLIRSRELTSCTGYCRLAEGEGGRGSCALDECARS